MNGCTTGGSIGHSVIEAVFSPEEITATCHQGQDTAEDEGLQSSSALQPPDTKAGDLL